MYLTQCFDLSFNFRYLGKSILLSQYLLFINIDTHLQGVRTASVVTREPTEVLRIDKRQFCEVRRFSEIL